MASSHQARPVLTAGGIQARYGAAWLLFCTRAVRSVQFKEWALELAPAPLACGSSHFVATRRKVP
eukprot:1136928-Alexandrium_andersonii.AAC.1